MCSDLPIAHSRSVTERCSSPQIIPSPKSQGFPSPLQKRRFQVMKHGDGRAGLCTLILFTPENPEGCECLWPEAGSHPNPWLVATVRGLTAPPVPPASVPAAGISASTFTGDNG